MYRTDCADIVTLHSSSTLLSVQFSSCRFVDVGILRLLFATVEHSCLLCRTGRLCDIGNNPVDGVYVMRLSSDRFKCLSASNRIVGFST